MPTKSQILNKLCKRNWNPIHSRKLWVIAQDDAYTELVSYLQKIGIRIDPDISLDTIWLTIARHSKLYVVENLIHGIYSKYGIKEVV